MAFTHIGTDAAIAVELISERSTAQSTLIAKLNNAGQVGWIFSAIAIGY